MGQTIVKNIGWLSLAEIFWRGALLALAILIARSLGAENFGAFQFALSFASFFIVFSDLGLSDIILREFSREKELEKDYSPLFGLKVFLSIGAFAFIVLGSFFITEDFLVRKLIWILAGFVVLNNFFALLFALFQAREEMQYKAFIRGVQAVVMLALGSLILFRFPSLENIGYGYVASTFAVLLGSLVLFHLRVKRLALEWNKDIWKKYLTMSWPVGGAALVGGVYVYIDSIMLGYFGEIIQTGWYNAAYQLVAFTIIPAILIAIAFVPSLSRALQRSREEFQRIWTRFFQLMTFSSVVFAIGGFFLAPTIIPLLYGEAYHPSIFAFQILIFMGSFNFLYISFSTILVVAGHQRKYFFLQAGAALLNIALNILLIPSLSLYGAALATVITYGVLLIFGMLLALRFTPIRFTLNLT